jgi:tRNA1(Val) A37 N6-methylase TrmN6
MAAPDFSVHPGDHIRHAKLARLGGNLGVEQNLQQQVAKLLRRVGRIVLVERLERFVGLLEQIAADGFVRLLAVPRAALGRAPGSGGT